MTLRAAQPITRAGVTPTFNAAAAGDQVPCGDKVFVDVKNGGGSPVTATFITSATEAGLQLDDVVVSVPAGGDKVIGPFPAHLFANAVDGNCHITWSATTSVTFSVLAL